MITLILGENGSGKTTYINNKYKELDETWTKLFFPTASELWSLINDKEAENFKGPEGTQRKPKCPNPLNVLLRKIITNISHSHLDNTINEWVNDSKEKIWGSLNLKIDEGNTKFESFCLDLSNNIKSQFEIVWPDVEKIVSRFDEVKSYSHGEISFYFMQLCFNIISLNEDKFAKIALFLDEPDNYLHPKFISEFIEKIVEVNNLNNANIFVTSHNYFFISQLLSKSELDSTKIKIYKIQDKKITTMVNDITNIKNCCAARLLYDIYKIYTLEFLDYLIGETGEGFDRNGERDADIAAKHPYLAIKDKKDKITYIENSSWKHHTHVNLIRNWYHHPKDRSDIEKDFIYKTGKQFNSDKLLKIAIDDLIRFLGNKYQKIAFENSEI